MVIPPLSMIYTPHTKSRHHIIAHDAQHYHAAMAALDDLIHTARTNTNNDKELERINNLYAEIKTNMPLSTMSDIGWNDYDHAMRLAYVYPEDNTNPSIVMMLTYDPIKERILTFNQTTAVTQQYSPKQLIPTDVVYRPHANQ